MTFVVMEAGFVGKRLTYIIKGIMQEKSGDILISKTLSKSLFCCENLFQRLLNRAFTIVKFDAAQSGGNDSLAVK